VVITGVSGGIGLELAKQFVKRGFVTYGISRSPVNLCGVHHIICDVTDEAACRAAVEKIGKIDILINNAGMGISGSVENTIVSDAKKLFEVNFFGLFNMTKAALPSLREKRGRIVNVSSVGGRLALPFQSFYSASKVAVDALSSALRAEVKPFGVQVMTVLPGDTKTLFTQNREKQRDDGIYQERCRHSLAKMEKDEQNGMSAEKVAKVIVKNTLRRRMPPIKTVGFLYKLFILLFKILPARPVEWVVFKMYG
jgi:short-subunit dehydrogenase